MLNEDVLRLIFEECNLDAAVALSETNKLCNAVYKTLDDLWFKQRVLERVPWFSPVTASVSWKTCARQLLTRSQNALDRRSEHLLLIKDLNVAMSQCHNDVVGIASWDIARDANVRLGMKPLFAEKVDTGVLGDYKLEGTHLVGLHMDLDLRTLILRRSDFDMDEEEARVVERRNKTVSERGTKIRHQSTNGWVQVVAENDNLIQVRLNTGEGVVDEIVHKASHKKAADGTILMSAGSTGPRFRSKDHHTVGLANLLPQAGGALVMKYNRQNPGASYLAYIEPNAELSTLILCTIPSPFDPRMRANMGFESADIRFYTAYNGYVYIFIHGRFLQLWVDLGYRMQLDDCLGDSLEWKKDGRTKSRALTAWNKNFAAMGTMNHAQFENINWTIVRGRNEGDLNRFVTLDGMGGCVVGDLLTGKTYVAIDTLQYKGSPAQMAIAYATGEEEKPVGFYTLDSKVCEDLNEALEMSHMVGITRERNALDMTGVFNDWCAVHRERWEIESSMGLSRATIYGDVVGDGLYLLTRGQNPLNEIYLSFRKEPLGPKNINTRSHFRSVDNLKPIRKIVNSQTKKCTLWACRGH